MTIQFQTTKIVFNRATGGPRSNEGYASFTGKVLDFGASLNSWFLCFSSSEHPLNQEKIDVKAFRDTRNDHRIRVEAVIALKDNSGNYDDAFEGYVEALVVANVENDPAFRGGSRIALRATNGKYVSAEAGAGGKLMATKATIGDEERFTLEIIDNISTSYLADRNHFALRASNGKFVCAEGGGGGDLIANRDQIGPWETFMLRKLEQDPSLSMSSIADNEKIALFANNGKLVCAEGGGDRELGATRNRVGSWETFVIIRS